MFRKTLLSTLLIISFFVVLIILCRCGMWLRRSTNTLTHAEDCYHDMHDVAISASNHSIKQRVYSIVNCSSMSGAEFLQYYDTLKESLIKFHREWFGSFIDSSLNDADVVNYFETFNLAWQETDIVSSFFYADKKLLVTTFNHTYAGGYHYIMYGQLITDAKKIPNIPKRPIMLGVPEFYALKCLFYRPDKSPPNALQLTLHSDPAKMERCYTVLSHNQINSYFDTVNVGQNLSTKSHTANTLIPFRSRLIYYTLMHAVKAFPKMYRKLRVLFPVAFQPEPHVFNNISAVLLEFDNSMTLQDTHEALMATTYQAVGGNYIAQFNCIGSKDVKSYVDMVITMAYWKDMTYEYPNIVTYTGLADYPLYCTLMSSNSNVVASFTLSSPEVKTNILIKEFNGHTYDINKLDFLKII